MHFSPDIAPYKIDIFVPENNSPGYYSPAVFKWSYFHNNALVALKGLL
jgi:hypothetical protein